LCVCVWVLLGGWEGCVRQSAGWMGGGVVAILWGLSLGRHWVWIEARSLYVWSEGCVVCAGGPRIGGLSYAFATV
jgi:hypothetical protein